MFGDRVNEIDLRIAKILTFGRTRTNVGFDVYNLLNVDAGAAATTWRTARRAPRG